MSYGLLSLHRGRVSCPGAFAQTENNFLPFKQAGSHAEKKVTLEHLYHGEDWGEALAPTLFTPVLGLIPAAPRSEAGTGSTSVAWKGAHGSQRSQRAKKRTTHLAGRRQGLCGKSQGG